MIGGCGLPGGCCVGVATCLGTAGAPVGSVTAVMLCMRLSSGGCKHQPKRASGGLMLLTPPCPTHLYSELQQRVIELVEKVLTLKGHVDARAHEHYKYARDTLDDSLLQLVSCLQARHSKYAYQLLAKAADPAKAARGWRWAGLALRDANWGRSRAGSARATPSGAG
jgi:hypothetical protein